MDDENFDFMLQMISKVGKERYKDTERKVDNASVTEQGDVANERSQR